MVRIETALTRLLGIEHPILTASMSGIVGGALANAVSHAGALGVIGPEVEAIRREVAAAGIADGRGLAAALSPGASGVSMGTRFTASRESLWTDAHKAGVLAGQADQSVQTRLYDTLNDPDWPRQFPARYLRNKTRTLLEGREAEFGAAAVLRAAAASVSG